MRNLKYTLGILLIASISFLACRKHNNSSVGPANATYFIFGRGGGFCGGACDRYFKIADHHIYEGHLDSTFKMQYSNTPMSVDKYDIALPVKDKFPSYLTARPNIDIKCNNCADMTYIHLEYQVGSTVYTWNIDEETNTIPAEIRSYMNDISTILGKL